MEEKKEWKTPRMWRFGTVEDLTAQISEIPGQGGCIAGGFHSNPGQYNQYYADWVATKKGGCSDALNQTSS